MLLQTIFTAETIRLSRGKQEELVINPDCIQHSLLMHTFLAFDFILAVLSSTCIGNYD